MTAEIQIETVHGVKVLHLRGSLTQEGLAEIEPGFHKAVAAKAPDKPARLVIDITNVDAVTTPAITLFLSTVRNVQPTGGKVVFTGLHGITADIFSRCRLDAIFTIAPNQADAVKLALKK